MKLIKQKFNKAASRYEQYDQVQKHIAKELIERLNTTNENIVEPINNIIDVGCGTGNLFLKLQNLYPDATITGMDIAVNMLQQNSFCYHHNICADFRKLPFGKNTYDLAIANMSLHWQDNLALTLNNIFNIMSKNGSVAFSIPIDGSLLEIKQAYKDLPNHTSAKNNFIDHKTLENILANYRILDITYKTNTLLFDNFTNILQHFKHTGTSYYYPNKTSGLKTIEHIKQLECAYMKQKTNAGKLPLSYRIAYVVIGQKENI